MLSSNLGKARNILIKLWRNEFINQLFSSKLTNATTFSEVVG